MADGGGRGGAAGDYDDVGRGTSCFPSENGGEGYSSEEERDVEGSDSEAEFRSYGSSSDVERYCSAKSAFGGSASSSLMSTPCSGRRNQRFLFSASSKAKRDQTEDGLVMDSSVAFGSDDWDDFVLDGSSFDGNSTLRPCYLYDHDPVEGASNLSPVSATDAFKTMELNQTNGNVAAAQDLACSPPKILISNEYGHLRKLMLKRDRDGTCGDTAQRKDFFALFGSDGLEDLSFEGSGIAIDDGSHPLHIFDHSHVASSSSSESSAINTDLLLPNHVKLAADDAVQVDSLLKSIATVAPNSAGSRNVASGHSLDDDDAPAFAVDTPLKDVSSKDNDGALQAIRFVDASPAKSFHLLSNEADHQGPGNEMSLRVTTGSSQVMEEDNKDDKNFNDSFDDMVLEMEEILLDSVRVNSTVDSQKQGTQKISHSRDGGLTASTSVGSDAYLHSLNLSKIDWVEVIGAKQRKGDVSFADRMIGVKEYTVYLLRVWNGEDKWEIERRYRDFFALYRQLKDEFSAHGLNLPPPWSKVERESKKIFGNASPLVVSERSDLIQICLQSILTSSYHFEMPVSLVSFLMPGRPPENPGFLKNIVPHTLQKLGGEWYSKSTGSADTSQIDEFAMGKTVSLVVEIKLRKSIRQLLESQHYKCAGCHKHLDAGTSLLQELAQSIGWNKARLCEYTGQLFCISCHTNDSAVLPARVLHNWDFSLYPVSQLAKAYLDSIHDKPMLCLSAVNPFLFSKVPALVSIMTARKRIAAMLPYVVCTYQSTIKRGLGYRRYLLDSNDFFALRDLIDLSKGVFSGLPVMMKTISKRILEHITQQCLVCYDAGAPCAARRDCDDPSSLIFPFQEVEATKCVSCGSIFHDHCFRKLKSCPCLGMSSRTSRTMAPLEQDLPVNYVGRDAQPVEQNPQQLVSNPASGFLSEMLYKARPDKIWKPRNANPVILMGSLSGTS